MCPDVPGFEWPVSSAIMPRDNPRGGIGSSIGGAHARKWTERGYDYLVCTEMILRRLFI